MTSRKQKRWLLATAHLAICSVFLWAFYPRPTPDNLQIVEGIPVVEKSGGRMTVTSFKVGDILMSCHPDALGPDNNCPTHFQMTSKARVTYFRMPTLMSVLGGGAGSAMLIKLEQNNELILANTEDDLDREYKFGSILTIWFFVLSYFSLIQLKSFRDVK